MSLARVDINFLRTQSGQNPQDYVAYPMVIDVCSSGPLNTPTQISSLSDLQQFGYGPLVKMAAGIANMAKYPIFVTRANTSTAGTIGTITKTLGNPVGTPVVSFGATIVPGAANGNVLIYQKQAGVSITVVDPGAVYVATTVTVLGNAITVTLKHDAMAITETGTGLAAAINGTPAAFALVSATALGTGAGLAGALTTKNLDNGSFNLTALQLGVTYEIVVSGVMTAFATAYNTMTKKITITMGTDAEGAPITTAGAVVASLIALAALNPGVFTTSLVGNGTLSVAAKSTTSLPFGSSGTMIAAGSPTDAYNIVIEITRPGTVGVTTDMAFTWSADGVTPFGEVIIPLTGIVALSNSKVNTGVTVTFSGYLDIGDKFTFSTTAPTVNTSDLLDAVDAALLSTTIYKFGYITSTKIVDRALLTLLDNKLQAVRDTKFVQGMFNTRGINTGETEQQWMTALITDFIGFVSDRGLCSICAGGMQYLDPYTTVQGYAPISIIVSGRRSTMDMHQDMGQVEDGQLPSNVISIEHDEFLRPGLDAQRFITLRTFESFPGKFFVSSDVTLADSNDTSYTEIRNTNVIYTGARVTYDAAHQLLNQTFEVMEIQESPTVPIGAISKRDAQRVQKKIVAPLRAILEKPKRNTSSPSIVNTTDNQLFIVFRNYSLRATKELRGLLTLELLGIAEIISIPIVANNQ